MVVLVGEFGNYTEKVIRKNTHTAVMETLSVPYFSSCYYKVVAFDVESDGSTGTLAVPGVMERNTEVPCYKSGNILFTMHISMHHDIW